ncbi:MAG TPA: flavin reductase family protein [Bryobacteraceae bacterium]|nr:flavin reductase family protein [Bryobacteraceae bacterium]
MELSIVDQDTFRRACSRFATGIAVATVTGPQGEPYGLTVNSFTSVSCCPPMILICVDYRCSILAHFRSSSFFGVNILSDSQRDLSVRFAQRESDHFERVDWVRGETGVPLLSGVLGALECCVSQTIEAGDHAIFIAEVVKAQYKDGRPLVYYRSSYRQISAEA